MENNKTQITDYDIKMLKKLTCETGNRAGAGANRMEKLTNIINNAMVISQKEAPSYLVTMNCRLGVVDLADNVEKDFWLVYPEKALQRPNNISVVSEFGTAVIGKKVGDEFVLVENQNEKRFRISRISYQPEANNHYKL